MNHFSRGSLTFPVVEQGPEQAEAVVLLHGFPQRASSWDRLAATLAGAGYRVLAPDQRGYAPGALPAGRRAYAMGELVEDVLALLDAAGLKRAHLVGHDWGGAVAWAFAARHPDRLQSLTVLSTPHPAAMARAVTSGTQALRSWYMPFFQVPWLPERLLDPARPAGRRRFLRALQRSGLSRAAAERDADAMAAPGVLAGALNWYRALPFSGRPGGRIDVPTLFVWGERDAFLGRKAAEATGQFIQAPYTFAPIDAGHWLQDLPEVAELLQRHLAERSSQGNERRLRDSNPGGS